MPSNIQKWRSFLSDSQKKCNFPNLKNNKKISQKLWISAGKMYSTICAELAAGAIVFGLVTDSRYRLYQYFRVNTFLQKESISDLHTVFSRPY